MFTLKYTASRQRLDLPEYKLSESKEAVKSTFIDETVLIRLSRCLRLMSQKVSK